MSEKWEKGAKLPLAPDGDARGAQWTSGRGVVPARSVHPDHRDSHVTPSGRYAKL